MNEEYLKAFKLAVPKTCLFSVLKIHDPDIRVTDHLPFVCLQDVKDKPSNKITIYILTISTPEYYLNA